MPEQGRGRFGLVLPRAADVGLFRAAEHVAEYIERVEGNAPTVSVDDQYILGRNEVDTLIVVGGPRTTRCGGSPSAAPAGLGSSGCFRHTHRPSRRYEARGRNSREQ